MKEFELIEQYFQQETLSWCNEHVALGIGDDCAVLNVPAHQQMCISMDTLVEDIHFPKYANPYDIATRALCVTLSDLAAMGATPLGFTLAITLPIAQESWLKEFSEGLIAIAQQYQCPLMGGDTTRGPLLVISIQVHGIVEKHSALKRSGAQIGDYVYVSGNLGNGAGALPHVLQHPKCSIGLANYFWQPLPCIEFGKELVGKASACLDVSDGLVQDLNHICKASGVGIKLELNSIPLSDLLLKEYGQEKALQLALSGGDDYQLAFTANKEKCLPEHSKCIGRVIETENKNVLLPEQYTSCMSGFNHFS